MRILVQNLLTNAIKYTPAEGQVRCELTVRNSDLLLTVADTGCGIPEAEQNKVYEKFFRTEAARKIDPNGNGLGMYIVKSIVDLAGGKIWFDSAIDQGTTFYVTIPLKGMAKREGVKGLVQTYS